MASIDIGRAIEVAEHNGCWAGDNHLVVFDALQNDRYNGIRLEVWPAATAVGGWCALARDGVSRAVSCWSDDRQEAVEQALNGYLQIRNHGI